MFFMQGLTDMVVAVLLVLMTIWMHHAQKLSSDFENLQLFLFEYSILLSIVVLLMASLERFVSIR